MEDTKPLNEGLKEAYQWYKDNKGDVWSKEYIKYIDENIARDSIF